MFTGIVEEMGEIKEIKQVSEKAIQMKIQADIILEDVKVGDSIAVNGVCLTVTAYDDHAFYVDIMPESYQATSLASLQQESKVNVERSLRASDRFGGHFVTGHVDGTGVIVGVEPKENAVYYEISLSEELLYFMIQKGSVAIDGISLTIFGVNQKEQTITLSLIPHTMEVTVLGKKTIQDIVNIECDMFAKQVDHFVRHVHQP